MTAVDKTSRQALLERGWYVVADVETAFLGLSGKAHDLLIILKHFQGKSPEEHPSQERLATILRCSVRTIQRTLKELESKGALSFRRTGRANRHRVTFVLGTVTELRILLGGEIKIPGDLATADTTPDVTSDTTDSDATPYIREIPREVTTSPSLREGGDAAAPQPETGLEDDMTWNRHEKPDELDPGTALDLWPSQETPEDTSGGLEGLFPAEEVAPAPGARQQPARSQRQLDAPYALASELAALLQGKPWAGPNPVNRSALSRNFSQWKRDGLTADQIRQMMRAYLADESLHTPGYAPWKSFVNLRHRLLAVAERRQRAEAMETTRHDPAAAAEYFLGAELAAQQPEVDEETILHDIAAWNAAR